MISTRSIPARSDGARGVHAVVETPRGSRNKYKFDPDSGCFKLSHVLPVGAVFPVSFGFIPNTRGEDGDPLDVAIFTDEPLPMGCLADVQLVGILEAMQVQNGRRFRNDRLLAVTEVSGIHRTWKNLSGPGPKVLDDLIRFFVSYNEARGREFRLRGIHGPARAIQAVRRGMAAANDEGS